MIVSFLGLASTLLASLPANQRAETAPDLATLMPGSTLIYAEAPALGDLLLRGADDPLARALAASPVARSLGEALDEEARAAVATGREILDGSVPSGLGALLAKGAAVGVSFKRGTPSWLVLARAADPERLATAVERGLALVAEKLELGDALAEPAETIEGAEVWYLGESLAIARRGDLLLLAPDEGALRGALDKAADPDEADLAGEAGFTKARERRRGDELLWVWADLGRARDLGQKLPEEKRPLREFEAMARNPGVHALLGSAFAHAGSADSLVLALRATGAPTVGLEIELHADGAALPRELAPDETPPPPLPDAPGGSEECGSLLAYRDLAGLYARRAELFETETLPGIQEGIAGLALFFGGVDFGEEVLPRISPWYRIVARPAEFARDAKPEIEYPAGALLIELREPDRDGPAFVSAFQSFIAVINVDRAQQRQPPMRLSIGREGEVEISLARFAPPPPGDGVDQVHNLAPACALAGSTFVAGTHESLVRAIVRDLAAGRVKTQSPGLERLRLDGPALATFVDKNLGAIALASSLDEGKSLEQAEAETRVLRDLLASIASIDATLAPDGKSGLVLRASVLVAATKDVASSPGKSSGEPR